MIHALIIMNRQGKVRLGKWYSSQGDDEKRKLLSDLHRVMVSRSGNYSNFVEYKNFMLLYRQYAALYFCIVVDPTDNLLAGMEAIHVFVEILDRYFKNVCELDLVQYFWKVYAIVDEVFLAGEIMETSKKVVLERIAQIDKE